jgi:Kdo2-lipid IVA lauroyltransferase/acyltransferase
MRALSLAALNFLSWLAHRLSVEQVSNLGAIIGWWLGAGGRRTARAYQNLALAMPETSPAERKAIVRRAWNNFGRTVAETLVLDRFAADPTRITLTNPEVLEECGKDGRGTVFTGMHFANWEVTTIPIVRRGIKPVSVYKPLKNEDVTAWLVRHREPIYPGGMYPASRTALWRMTKHVRSGGAICISGDHRDPAGISVPFFGQSAASGALPALLAVRYGARLFAIRVDRLPKARFTLTIEPIAVSDTGDMDVDVARTTAAVQAKFEQWVRAEPGLWRWFYRRWDDTGKGPQREDEGFRLGEIDGTITSEADVSIARGSAAAE